MGSAPPPWARTGSFVPAECERAAVAAAAQPAAHTKAAFPISAQTMLSCFNWRAVLPPPRAGVLPYFFRAPPRGASYLAGERQVRRMHGATGRPLTMHMNVCVLAAHSAVIRGQEKIKGRANKKQARRGTRLATQGRRPQPCACMCVCVGGDCGCVHRINIHIMHGQRMHGRSPRASKSSGLWGPNAVMYVACMIVVRGGAVASAR